MARPRFSLARSVSTLYNRSEMPIYIYEHIGKPGKGCEKEIEIRQEFGSEHLEICPICGREIKRIIKSANFSIDRLGHTTLKEKGFTKLVRRDKGTYEVEGAGRKD
jgi:predicted nucleic acid-binding Zn ribbon protein